MTKLGKCKKQPVKEIKYDGRILYHAYLNYELRILKQPDTNVIVHGSKLEEVPLDPICGVKRARMVQNPFIKAMKEKWQATKKKK